MILLEYQASAVVASPAGHCASHQLGKRDCSGCLRSLTIPYGLILDPIAIRPRPVVDRHPATLCRSRSSAGCAVGIPLGPNRKLPTYKNDLSYVIKPWKPIIPTMIAMITRVIFTPLLLQV